MGLGPSKEHGTPDPYFNPQVNTYPAVYHGFSGRIVREVVISKDVIENYERLSKHTMQLKQVSLASKFKVLNCWS